MSVLQLKGVRKGMIGVDDGGMVMKNEDGVNGWVKEMFEELVIDGSLWV